MPTLVCPLCCSQKITPGIQGADQRRYHYCGQCRLIFVDPVHHLTWEQQKGRYLLHDNRLDNSGYVQFLCRAVNPMLQYLTPEMRGLDFGCGPGPTLSRILVSHGMACDDYDPIFVEADLNPPYDYIFATECFEHFLRPSKEIQRILTLLSAEGYLAIMTERWTTLEAFRDWYYTLDVTHVCFFHTTTFDYVCNTYGFDPLPVEDNRITLLQRRKRLATGK